MIDYPQVSPLTCPISMFVLGEINSVTRNRLSDFIRWFGCRSLRDPHRIDPSRLRPAFGERVCLSQCCRTNRRDGQDRSKRHFWCLQIGFYVTRRQHSICNPRSADRGYTGREGIGPTCAQGEPAEGGCSVPLCPARRYAAIRSGLPADRGPAILARMRSKSRETI